MSTFIKHQESYSRGELLLRTFFGTIYIIIPHFFLLFFVSIGAMVLSFLAFWVVLFTGKYPRGWWDFMVNLFKWTLRINARMWNLADGYPAFGLNGTDNNTNFAMQYPEKLSQGLLIVRVLFGGLYVGIPHGLCLFFLFIAATFVNFLSFWIILFTGNLPKGLHDFQTGVLRWSLRVSAYLYFLTDTYPPFSLEEDGPTNQPLDQGLNS
ncbi:MAG: DUF4389 domain-containing protein [Flavobacteriales bacterium]|nr:DUF4389 domain-containing protein [Flavobacteriales bacterium]